jgi:hypothetical protein
LWIEPSTFHPEPGATVAVGLRVGQNFAGDAVPRSSESIERFIVRQADDDPIKGLENTDPAGWLRADGRATAVIVYRSRPSFIELPAATFEDYLRLEGLDRIIDLRARRAASAKPGRELFSRCAKALLTGAQPSAGVTQPVGLRYEIVPDEDPTTGAAPFRGHVLYEGRRLAGDRVVAILRSDPSVRMERRCDAQGAFSFLLPRAGVWLIKAVHMVEVSLFSFSGADWESLWGSLTFESPPASSGVTKPR